jgi:ATP-dependent protease ClpP protease subunit
MSEIDNSATQAVGQEDTATAEQCLSAELSPQISVLPISRTPMYLAQHAARYQRQELIRKIQAHTGRKLISYVAGSAALINRDDTLGVVDLLHNLNKGDDLDLLLNTSGGDMDAAEKLISLVRARVTTGQLRVIVPDYAKSSGTLIATGADAIVMSDSSELGPIDPQITLTDGHGNHIPHSVQSYLDAYKSHSEILRANPNDPVAKIMLEKLDPAMIKLFQAAIARARGFAEGQLRQGMFRMSGGNFTAVAASLIDTGRWLSHGQVIGPEDAADIGLKVEYLEPRNETWCLYWQLYTLQRFAISDRSKIFESDYASFVLEGQ